MHEPFASNLGTASLLKHLDLAHSAVEKFNNDSDPEPEATDLLEQITDLVVATVSLDDLATRERRSSSAYRTRLSAADLLHLRSVCSSTATMTQECLEFIEPLRSRLEDVRGIMGSATAESRLGSQDWYLETYEGLKLRTEVLRVLFSAISVLLHKNDTDEDGQLSNAALSSASALQYQIGVVNPKLHGAHNDGTTVLRRAVAAAIAVTIHVPASLNKHSNIGRSVKPFYTGREAQMAKLQDAFGDVEYPSQKRFVIFGLGGSGKTELALKYAEDHLQNFWGVFFVDGSSRKNAAGSYLEIATIAGVEPHEKAARNWLTTRALPWLLIIDNVDDDEVRLEELLPMGTKGCILITSRNPAHKSWGTVGEKYLELLPMESEEANELILKAAEEPSPWAKGVKDSASSICAALGFLPLALVHAGRAIFFRLCPWHGYLSFYDRHWQRIRRKRHHQRRRSFSRERMASNDVDDNMNVFSSYEILYESLSSSETQRFQDAVELLHVFSYLHFQNIRLDIFIKAAINLMKEAKNMEKDVREAEELQKGLAKLRRRTWSTWIREQVLRVGQYLDTPPPLPAALKNLDPGLSESNVENEVHDRLCMALEVLVSRSLITNSDRLENRYCMHRLVHKWVRERPDISTSQQALWCQVASTVLARCILFPPLGEEEHERSMRRELLPHIIEVQKCQKVIRDRLIENRAGRKLYWPVTDTEFGKLQAIEAARFSRVYLECGLFNIAHQLQSKVRTFVIERLGEEHMISIRITLFLTVTLYNLSRASDATQLQRRVYDVCLKSLGQHHPLTLKVTDSLASSLCFQGRWSESLTLHERAIEGMTVVFGKAHENTLLAMNNLAKLYERYMEFEKCVELHRVAWEGMKERLGELHFDTLLCLEDLATSSLRLGGEYLLKAHDMMTFVLERRREMLVKEHPYILLAIANLGRVKSALGQHDEAARIMRDALNIAERNLGEDHFGVLYGKTQYAQVLVHLGRYEEAEKMFHNVVEKPQYRKATNEDGEHPDRIIALWYLTGCLEKQGKFRDALQVCEGLMESLREIGGNGLGTRHKFASILREEIEKLEGKIAEDSKQITDADLVATKDFGRGI